MARLELTIPPVVILLLCAITMWLSAKVSPTLTVTLAWGRLGALVLVGLGGVLAVLALISFQQSRTTFNPHKPGATSSLVTTGVYRLTRNPMYLGMLVLLAAWALYLGNLLALSGLALFVLYMNRFQIIPEEVILLDKFGVEFTAYQSRVRRWL